MERTSFWMTLKTASALLLVSGTMAATRTFDANYVIEWQHTDENIIFTLTVNSSGWIGLGFSPTGGMLGADIVLAFINGNGSVTLQDRHAVGNFLPPLDAQHNYRLLSGSRNGNNLQVTFVRPLDTCDADDVVIKPYTTKVIYAYGNLDASGTPTYHGSRRGVVSMLLLNQEPPVIDSQDTFYIDPVPPPIILPRDQTTYWCSLIKLPEVSSKNHIIALEPVISANNTDIVHHIVIYGCDTANESASSYNYLTGDDGGNNGLCTSIVGIWAIGALAYRLPLETGIPIGGAYGPKYVLIQTHYNNVLRQNGRVDDSRIRFLVTPHLRQYDAGAIQTGVVEGIFIPPGALSFNVGGYCSQNCLGEQNLPTEGLTIFGASMHSHLLGRAITLRRLRPTQGQLELETIVSDPYFDFKYQDARSLSPYLKLQRGDILQTICTMDSSERSDATLGGFSTEQEMCLSYIFYYPRTNISHCQTYPLFAITNDPSFYSLIGSSFSNFNWSRGYFNNITGTNWTADIVSAIESKYFGTSIEYCNGNSPHAKIWSPPEIFKTPVSLGNISNPSCQKVASDEASTTNYRNAQANTTFLKFQLSFQYSSHSIKAIGSVMTLALACKLALVVN